MYRVREVKHTNPVKIRLTTGEEYGFYLTTRGAAYVSGRWNLTSDDLMILKPRQSAEVEFPGGRVPLSAVWVTISTERMAACSGERTDIIAGFRINPEPVVRIRSHSSLLMLVKNLAARLQALPNDELGFGVDLLEESTIQMFLALVLRTCILEDPHRAKPETRSDNHLSLDEVFAYIHNHLTEDLSLARLEQEFYVSRHHLIREFKKRTGQTVHQYIVKARLELSRRYIAQGYSVNDVYYMGGFNGYNHFFKAFRKAYGMTPGEYYRSVHERAAASEQ